MTIARITPVIILCFAFNSLYAQPQPKTVADRIVAVVGDKIVLESDITNALHDMERQGMELPPDAKCLTLEQNMGIKALVLQAEKDSIPITEEEIDVAIDNQIRGFINAYGSKDELERVAQRSVYQLKEDFREGFRERKLAESMRNKIVENIKITPNEVKHFFEKIPTDSLPLYESEVEIGQVVSFPKASQDANEYAIEQLKDYKHQIEAGSRDFKTLASLYSDDPGSKERGGMYEVNRANKEFDPVWMSKAFTLKPGQISNPFKTRFGYHIIQLESRTGDDAIVRHILKIPQVTQVEMKTGYQKLDSVRAKLIAGTIDFGTAVSKYSEDDASKFTAGRLQGKDGSGFLTIDQLDKDMVPILKNLSVGEYSQPVEFTDERGKKGIRVAYLISRSSPHRENLKDDYSRIAAKAMEEKKNNAIEKWFQNKIKTYHIEVDQEYRSCTVMQKWIQAANTAKH